jgi:hypothetical protein
LVINDSNAVLATELRSGPKKEEVLGTLNPSRRCWRQSPPKGRCSWLISCPKAVATSITML